MDVSRFVFQEDPRMGACCRIIGDGDFRVCLRPRIVDSWSGGFRYGGHLRYYKSGCGRSRARCEAKKKEDRDSTNKKKLKLLKGLTKDLSTFSEMDHPHTQAPVSQFQGKTIAVTETAEILLKQLQLLKAEEKELKRKRKQEKARLKATQPMETKVESESSSSESSDNEWVQVRDTSSVRNEAAADCDSLHDHGRETSIRPSEYSGVVDSQVRNTSASAVEIMQGKKIEVCMGGKCTRLGGAALLEEFGRVMGVEGAAVGCKCMGKCRDGPNVRILNGVQKEFPVEDDSVRIPPNPLYIGVGLEDVGVIVANFFGQEKEVLDLNPS